MRQVLHRALYLLRSPWVVSGLGLLAVGGSALVVVPLFGVPGYELSEALALAVGLLGAGTGIAAALLERRLLQGRDPRPRGAMRLDSPLLSVGSATAAAGLLNVTFLLPPLLTASLYALTSTRCDPFAQIEFFFVLALPSALASAVVGVVCGLTAPRRRGAWGLFVLLAVLSAVVTAWPLLFGPQVFAFNHLGGYLPGPLYDEALAIRPGLLWARVETLFLGGALVGVAALGLDLTRGKVGGPRLRPLPAFLACACALGVAALEARAPELGLRTTHGYLEERLGGRRETKHFVFFFPREKSSDDVERFARDLEFRHAQLTSFLGEVPTEPIRVYWHRSPAEKGALVGASQTQFAKPWRLELHVNDAAFPHPVLKHELVHALASPFGARPFRVTARWLGLWPNAAVIEGLAVAGDDPVDELTLHEWSAGMRRQKLMPDLRGLLASQGFYGAPPARAYTAAGSFLRFLGEQHGPEKLRALYRDGDFARAYGRPLDELATEWERFLDSLPLDDEASHLAFARFRKGALFQRACAREVAALQQEATEVAGSNPDRALELLARCRSLQPDEIAFGIAEAQLLMKQGRKGDAANLLSSLTDKTSPSPALHAEVLLAQADVFAQPGDQALARQALERALELKVSPAVDRTARVRLAGLDSPQSGPAIAAYFRPLPDEVKTLALREALVREPNDATVAYLLGRRLFRVAPSYAKGVLQQALANTLPDTLRREAARLLLEASFLAGDCKGVRSVQGQLPDLGQAMQRRAREWVERCDFEDRSFNGPLVPGSPFQ